MRTRLFAEGRRVKAFDGIAHKLEMKLDQPGNRLEALKGGRKGQYSIRVNDQWRICFEWPKGSEAPLNVEVVDYR